MTSNNALLFWLNALYWLNLGRIFGWNSRPCSETVMKVLLSSAGLQHCHPGGQRSAEVHLRQMEPPPQLQPARHSKWHGHTRLGPSHHEVSFADWGWSETMISQYILHIYGLTFLFQIFFCKSWYGYFKWPLFKGIQIVFFFISFSKDLSSYFTVLIIFLEIWRSTDTWVDETKCDQ